MEQSLKSFDPEVFEIAVGDLRPALTWMTAAFGAGQMIAPVLAGIVFDVTRSFV